MRDKDVAVRRAAAEALGEVEDARDAGALAQAMDDEDLVVRRFAAQSLGKIADSTAVPALSKAYAGAESHFRYAIVKAPANTEDRRGDATLNIAQQDRDQTVRRVAAEAVKDRREDREDDDD